MKDYPSCKTCEYSKELADLGEPCSSCRDGSHFSKIELPPSPEALLADCLKNIEKTLSLIAKQQDNINERVSNLSTAVGCNSQAILLLNDRVDKIDYDNRLEES